MSKKQHPQKYCEPDRLNELNNELKNLQYNEESKSKENGSEEDEKAFEEVSNEENGNAGEESVSA